MSSETGRMLMLLGGAIFLIGVLITAAPRVPGLGRLPGDLVVQRDNFTLFAPCGTMIVVSLILTVVINVILRLLR
ncbi:MAG: DUF2905 domain-containing protein [Caldilineaceae bacterium]|nr:DUF2905 domain-containing protein [Caldilineaceae bacterium]MCB0145638.1 DUF2905 domain-containing protein [Caldilineaceae bacterium]